MSLSHHRKKSARADARCASLPRVSFGTKHRGPGSKVTRNDNVYTEHHVVPRSRNGSLQDVVWVLGARHRRWHTIFHEAPPRDALARLERIHAQCNPSDAKTAAILSHVTTDEGRARITRQLAVRKEAWEYLFKGLTIAQVRTAILQEWTVEGVLVTDPQRIPTCECYRRGRRKHMQGCKRPRPIITPMVLATAS